MLILDDTFQRAARGLFEPGERVLAGVSGGADSVALLRLLHAAAPALRLALVVGHVNHAMRGAPADDDERFVRDLASRLGLPCEVRRADPPPRTEEEARRARHHLLRETARAARCGRIALAHTMDDQAETILMRLVRGAGRRGLSGMAAQGPGRLVRPLLEVTREALREHLAGLGQPFREDETNADERRLRNKVRARLLPLLREMNPAIVASLARAGRLLSEEDAWMDRMANAWMSANARPTGPAPCAAGVAAPLAGLAALEPPLARRVARRLLREAGADPRGLPLAAVDRLLELARKGPAAHLDLPGGMQAERDGLLVMVRRARTAGAPPRPLTEARLSVPGRTDLPGPNLRIEARVVPADAADPAQAGARRALLDADRLGDEVTVRSRLAGDVFHPLGAPGPRRLSRFLIDRKVPRSARDGLVLIVGREGIAWVTGVEIGHAYRVTPGTRRVAVLEMNAPEG